MEAERCAVTCLRLHSWRGQSWDLHPGLSGIEPHHCSLFTQSRNPSFSRISCHISNLICPRSSFWGSPCWVQTWENSVPRHLDAAPLYVLCWIHSFSPQSLSSNWCGLSRLSPRGLKEGIANRCTALPTHIYSPLNWEGSRTSWVLPLWVCSWVLFYTLPAIFAWPWLHIFPFLNLSFSIILRSEAEASVFWVKFCLLCPFSFDLC